MPNKVWLISDWYDGTPYMCFLSEEETLAWLSQDVVLSDVTVSILDTGVPIYQCDWYLANKFVEKFGGR